MTRPHQVQPNKAKKEIRKMKGYSQSSLILPQPKPTLHAEGAGFPLAHPPRHQTPTVLAQGWDRPRDTSGVSHQTDQDEKTLPQMWPREREAPCTTSVQTRCAPTQSSTFKVIAINVTKVKQATF